MGHFRTGEFLYELENESVNRCLIMGDAADMALDHMFDEVHGHDDRYDASDYDVFYDDEETLYYEGPERPVSPKRCRYCGMTGLHWGKVGDKWRLFGSTGVHVCDGKKQKQLSNRERADKLLDRMNNEQLYELVLAIEKWERRIKRR